MKQVAVAYLTHEGERGLGLKRGDSLHCAMSIRNCKAGVVDPGVVARLQKRGVRVYAHESLHAKVFFTARAAIIGSANLTANSRGLIEAAVFTTDSRVLKAVGSWLGGLGDQEVSPEFLAACKKAYRPPSGPFTESNGGVSANSETLWITGPIYRLEMPQDLRQFLDETRAAAMRKTDTRKYRLDSFVLPGSDAMSKNIKAGDKVIPVWAFERGASVRGWGVCVAVNTKVSKNRQRDTIIVVELPLNAPTIPFSTFSRTLTAIGIRPPDEYANRKVTNPQKITALRAAVRQLQRR